LTINPTVSAHHLCSFWRDFATTPFLYFAPIGTPSAKNNNCGTSQRIHQQLRDFTMDSFSHIHHFGTGTLSPKHIGESRISVHFLLETDPANSPFCHDASVIAHC
jgi:hypothetical protein